MENNYRPTRLDHFPNRQPTPRPQGRMVGEGDNQYWVPKKHLPHLGSGDTLKMWLENHGLPVSKHAEDNVATMQVTTGGRS